MVEGETMTYKLSWYTPGKVLYLELKSQPAIHELEAINQEVSDILAIHKEPVNLLINAMEMKAGYETSNWLRDTQKYMNDPKVKQAYFVSDNKLNRLISLMAFSMSRVRLMQFERWQLAVDHLKRQGFYDGMSSIN